MANRGMIEHLPPVKIERFCARVLPVTELTTIEGHLAQCPECQREFVDTLSRQREGTSLSVTLAPEFWLRHEHLDYDQLLERAENKSDAIHRELIDVHLKVCTPCREDLRSLVDFVQQIAPELEVSYAPVEQEHTRPGSSWVTWWDSLAWRPIHAAVVVIITTVIVIGVALLLKRRAENRLAQQVQIPQVSPDSKPDNGAPNVPSPPVTPSESRIEKPHSSEAIVVLNDGGGTITVDKSGNVAGLDDVPPAARDEIAKVLLSERLEQPAILKELSGQDGTLRGSNNAQPFKLTYPSRTVIVSDRPTFKWGKASGATSYRVYINDPAGNEIAKSEELPSERREWVLPKPLKRGGVYVWTIVAVVGEKEIVSPGPSSPEMKFQVLSLRSLQQLNLLRKTRSHLALAVFYAREGMILEAQREFERLIRSNPGSQSANKLLQEIQSWQRR